jgi:hypothetical protein
VFEGRVAASVFQGDTLMLQVALADGQLLTARLVASAAGLAAVPAVGAPVRLGIAVADTVLLEDAGA